MHPPPRFSTHRHSGSQVMGKQSQGYIAGGGCSIPVAAQAQGRNFWSQCQPGAWGLSSPDVYNYIQLYNYNLYVLLQLINAEISVSDEARFLAKRVDLDSLLPRPYTQEIMDG